MAGYVEITVAASTYYVVQDSILDTECASTYTYSIYNEDDGDTIEITLTGNATNSYYISNGVVTNFSSSTSLSYDTSLTLYFTLENSGSAGVYDSIDITIENTTTSNPYTTFTETVTRLNDTAKCATSDCCGDGSSAGILAPQLFNPTGPEVTSGTAVFTLSQDTGIVFVTLNGQVIDDSEYSLTTNMLTVTPDNGFNAITDEILVFQAV